MIPWSEARSDFLALLAELPEGAEIRALGCDPGAQVAKGCVCALAEVSATIAGAVKWKRGSVRAAPLLRDLRLRWVGASTWRDGAAAREARTFAAPSRPAAPRVVAVEDQHWPFSKRKGLTRAEAAEEGADGEALGAGGRFRSLRNLAHCAGVVAGGAHSAANAAAHVFVMPPGSWKSAIGAPQGKLEARAHSKGLMRALGGPKRGSGGAAWHDLAAAVAIAVTSLGIIRIADQIVEPGPELAAWLGR